MTRPYMLHARLQCKCFFFEKDAVQVSNTVISCVKLIQRRRSIFFLVTMEPNHPLRTPAAGAIDGVKAPLRYLSIQAVNNTGSLQPRLGFHCRVWSCGGIILSAFEFLYSPTTIVFEFLYSPCLFGKIRLKTQQGRNFSFI